MVKNVAHLASAAVHFDFLPLQSSKPKEILPDGSHIFPVVLTYTGVRPYLIQGQEVLVLRRFEQVNSASHRRTLRMLTVTDGHPKVEINGVVYPVWLDVEGQGEIDELGCVHLPDAGFRVGHTGDSIEVTDINGYLMPTSYVSIKSPGCAASIMGGKTQTSLGYFSLRLPPPPEEIQDGYGIWNGPNGPQRYQLEQILDLEDPRLQSSYLVSEGIAKSIEEAEAIRKRIGANHLGANLIGRGGPDVEIQLDQKQSAFFDLGQSALSFCLDEDFPKKRLDTVEKVCDNSAINLNTPKLFYFMKHNIPYLVPRLARFLDEEGIAKLPPIEVDMPPEMIEVLKMAETAIMETFNALKAKIAEMTGGLKSAEEKVVAETQKTNALSQDKADLLSDRDKLRAERDQAIEELLPIRKERVRVQIEEAMKIGGLDTSKSTSFDSIEDARRAAVYTRLPHLKDQNHSNDYIAVRYEALCDSLKESQKDSFKQSNFLASQEDAKNPGLPINLVDAGKFEFERIKKILS